MSAIQKSICIQPTPEDLHSGDRMTRAEFHRIYQQMPEDFRAELIGGIVYVASPLKRGHAVNHVPLSAILGVYMSQTPGTEAGDNATVILDDDSEPQPDLYLRILPEFGGNSRTNAQDYVTGAPELVIEIAHSSRAIDLHDKRKDYAKYGVLEYLVFSLRDEELHWFDLPKNERLKPGDEGIARVRTFPGLGIDAKAAFARDVSRLLGALNEGLNSSEHAAFVKQLAQRRR